MSTRESTLLSPSSYSGVGTSRSLDESESHIIISLDYGTTYTGAAWALTEGRPLTLADIHVVNNWPPIANEPKVPSEYTYSPHHEGQHWGNNIDRNAKILQRTKLELPVQQRPQALRILAEALIELPQVLGNSDRDGASTLFPLHLIKTPGDIVADYLEEVVKYVRIDIESEKGEGFWKHFRIDLVVTHPAEWDDRARNTTFRASQKAFEREFQHKPRKLRDTYLVTEPEACAQYAIKELECDNIPGLKQDDCFIVVDAGGGTVDLVSYFIEEIDPIFRASKVTNATGASCGATRIEDYFLETFLRNRLELEAYNRLRERPETGGTSSYGPLTKKAKNMLSEFIGLKHSFEGRDETPGAAAEAVPIVLRLPEDDEEGGNHNGRGGDGLLRISQAEMEYIFKEPVDKTLHLIDDQVALLQTKKMQPKAIFLSGGFSRSVYLRKQVNEFARSHRGMSVICGQDSWSAVAKGAVLIGSGDDCQRPPAVKCVPQHIGIQLAPPFTAYDHEKDQLYCDSFDQGRRARDNVKWLVAKGDLFPDSGSIVKHEMVVRKVAHDSHWEGLLVIVRDSGDGVLHQRSNRLQDTGRGQLLKSFKFDLSGIIEGNAFTEHQLEELKNEGVYEIVKGNKRSPKHHRVVMRVEINVDLVSVRVILSCGKEDGHNGIAKREGITLLDEKLFLNDKKSE